MSLAATESAASFELRSGDAGGTFVALKGQFDAASTARVWRELEAALRQHPPSSLEVDASGIESSDGSGIALLHFLKMGGTASGVKATIKGLRPELNSLFGRFSVSDYQKSLPQPPPHVHVTEHVGEATVKIWHDSKELLAFLSRGQRRSLKRERRNQTGNIQHQVATPERPVVSEGTTPLTQADLASAVRVPEATLIRWESGMQSQTRAMDLLLRLFLESADVRRACVSGVVPSETTGLSGVAT